MSQGDDNADDESSKMDAEAVKLISEGEFDKEDQGMVVNTKTGSDVKAGHVANRCEIVEEGAQIGVDGDKDEESNSQLSQPDVTLNEYVIYEIAKYVGYRDLKSLRRVNKLWSAGATRQFLQKSQFILIYGQRGHQEQALVDFWHDTKNLVGIRALKISHICKYRSEKDAENFRHNISRLAPRLTSLVLKGWVNDVVSHLGPSIAFPALSKLSIEGYLGYELTAKIWRCLYIAAPKLTELFVRGFSPTVLSPLLTEDGARSRALAPNLSSLGLSCMRFGYYDSSPLWLPLVNFPQRWQGLDLSIPTFNEEELRLLFPLLEQNKDSLVSLKLKLDQDKMSPRLIHALPLPSTFPKLHKLELVFSQVNLQNAVTFGEDGSRAFSEIFTSLSSLSVQLPQNSENATGIWRSLFLPQVSRGLQRLKFLKVMGMEYVRFRPKKSGQIWAEKLFPSATLQIS